MDSMIGRGLATVIAVALTLCIMIGLAPTSYRGTVWQVVLIWFAWALAYFGDEVAPLVGVTTNSSTPDAVDSIIRALGWFLMGVTVAVYVAQAAHLWGI